MKEQLRIEVIPDIIGCKIVSEEEWYTVHFNQWYLVPFKFDGEKFFVETYNKEALKEFTERKEKEVAKLNRRQTEQEEAQRLKEMQDLPREKEETRVVYKKDPTEPTIDLALYVKELINE